jgi:hypothetical protein
MRLAADSHLRCSTRATGDLDVCPSKKLYVLGRGHEQRRASVSALPASGASDGSTIHTEPLDILAGYILRHGGGTVCRVPNL